MRKFRQRRGPAAVLGTKRDGAGIVIDSAGLVVTIGYLITEAMAAEVATASGKTNRAEIVGFDTESGLGLLRTADPLEVKPMPIGTSEGLFEKTPVIVAGHGGPAAAQLTGRNIAPERCRLLGILARRCDLYPAALYRVEGAALIASDDKLSGLGSLTISQTGRRRET
jgi:hypothetical protein